MRFLEKLPLRRPRLAARTARPGVPLSPTERLVRLELLAPGAQLQRRRSVLRRLLTLLVGRRRLVGTAALALDVVVVPATAAQIRHFPDNTQLGRIRFGAFPMAMLDGRAIRLGEHVRILNQKNTVVPPASVQGRSLLVAYQASKRDDIATIWILSDEEFRALHRRR